MNTLRLAVCIATLHRPQGLERALRSVLRQHGLVDVHVRVVVVNNDPTDASPQDVVRRLLTDANFATNSVAATETPHANSADTSSSDSDALSCEALSCEALSCKALSCRPLATSIDIQLVDEAERGPAHARNRALREVCNSCDLIAFLDDDEEAPEDWLTSLLHVKNTYDADVVTGGVVPIFEEPPPAWAIDGGFYARPSRPSGSPRPWAFTGNVLFDAALLDTIPQWFDPRFRQGEDRHFFARLAAAGARIVWCDAAPPREYVPAARVDRAWLAQRMRNIGKAVTAIEHDTPRARFAIPRNLAKGVVWILLGTAQQLMGCCTSDVRCIRGRMHRAYGVGLIEGACGLAECSSRGA